MWHKPFNLDQASVDYINAKGIKDPGGLIKVAQDFEKVARDRNVIDKPDPAKLKEWKGWTELGWTEDQAKYAAAVKKPVPAKGEVLHEGIFNAALKASQEARILPSQAEAVATSIHQAMNAEMKKIAAADAAETTKLDGALRTEWGTEFDTKKALGDKAIRAAVQRYGLRNSDLAALDQAMSSPGLVKLFADLGEQWGEDNLNGTLNGGGRNQGGNPEQARIERLKLEADPQWMKVFNDQRNPLHAQYVKDRQRLIDIEARGQRAA